MKNVVRKTIAGAFVTLTVLPAFAQQYGQQYQQPPQMRQQYQMPVQGGGLPIVPKAPNGGQYYQPSGIFDVRPGDATIRDVLTRWAAQTGWSFRPEHWTIDRDLPIAGAADASVFGFEFKGAVRKLLESSELTDRPVQPCFYSNHVIRVVPKAEICDKNNQ